MLGDDDGGTRNEDGKKIRELVLINGHASPCGESVDGLSLAVQPDAATCFSAQSVGGVGIVEIEGMGPVLHEVELLCDLVCDEIHAFRGTQIAFFLFVSFPATVNAVELSGHGGGSAGTFNLKEYVAGFVGGKKILRGMGGQMCRPFCGSRTGNQHTEKQYEKEPEQGNTPRGLPCGHGCRSVFGV